MIKNVGAIDKIIRLIIGTALLLVGFYVQISDGWRLAVFLVAAIAYVTAIWGFCHLLMVLGISTSKKEKAGTMQEPVSKPWTKPEFEHREGEKPHGTV
jgi:hypothetical protein